MPVAHLVIILVTVFMSASAQALLKFGADKIANEKGGAIYGDSVLSVITVFLNPYVFFGMLIYILSAVSWIWVLSKVDISLAYSFVSLSFVFTLIFGVSLFGEPLSFSKLLGTAFIVFGCLVIARS